MQRKYTDVDILENNWPLTPKIRDTMRRFGAASYSIRPIPRIAQQTCHKNGLLLHNQCAACLSAHEVKTRKEQFIHILSVTRSKLQRSAETASRHLQAEWGCRSRDCSISFNCQSLQPGRGNMTGDGFCCCCHAPRWDYSHFRLQTMYNGALPSQDTVQEVNGRRIETFVQIAVWPEFNPLKPDFMKHTFFKNQSYLKENTNRQSINSVKELNAV